MEMKNEVQGGKAIKDVFLLLSIFFSCDFKKLAQFDRPSAIYDSKNTGGLGRGKKLPRE